MTVNDVAIPSRCPGCGREMWRGDRRICLTLEAENLATEESFAVCMWCSSIWLLQLTPCPTWIAPGPDQLAAVMPTLGPVAERFGMHRRMDTIAPGWLEAIDAYNAERRRGTTTH